MRIAKVLLPAKKAREVLWALTKPELAGLAKALHVPSSGTKGDVIQRMIERETNVFLEVPFAS